MKEKTINNLYKEIKDIDYLIKIISASIEISISNYEHGIDGFTLSAMPESEHKEDTTKIKL